MSEETFIVSDKFQIIWVVVLSTLFAFFVENHWGRKHKGTQWSPKIDFFFFFPLDQDVFQTDIAIIANTISRTRKNTSIIHNTHNTHIHPYAAIRETIFHNFTSILKLLKETYYAFSMFSFAWVFYLCSFACRNVQKVLKVTEALLSHRKHCSSNTSSVVLPLILWLCDISYLCLAASLAHTNWFSTAALLLLFFSRTGSCMRELTNQSRLGI